MMAGLIMSVSAACISFGEKQADASSEVATEDAKVVASWISDTVYSYKSGVWELQIEYLQKESRSEGQNGVLLKDGKIIEHTQFGTILETPLGRLKYYGSERKRPWALTGWNFADRRKAKNSSQLPKKK
jgi:hypothetical protein